MTMLEMLYLMESMERENISRLVAAGLKKGKRQYVLSGSHGVSYRRVKRHEKS